MMVFKQLIKPWAGWYSHRGTKRKNMKKITIISAIALSGLFYSNANAQLLSIGLHLGGGRSVIQAAVVTPVAVSYSNADQYYYMPEVDAYYSPYERVYYYNDGGRWVSNAYLPGEYRNYDWRTARRYEVRAHRPYLNADIYRERYKANAREWNHRDDRFDNSRDDRFDNRRDDRFDNRRDDRFDNRSDRRDDGPRFERQNDSRGWNNGNRRDDRNDRGQGNYNQQPQQNWPSQPSRGNDNGRGRGQGGYNQQQGQQQQPQQNWPSRQNGGGQQRGSVNQGDHFAYNGGQNGQRRF